jgi:hypothetical protein
MPAEAAALLRRALANADVAFGPTHAALKTLLHDHSRILRRLGRRREARDLEQRAEHISASGSASHTVDVRDLSRVGIDATQR